MRALMKSLGDIWRLALPYFTTRDIGEARVWPLPRYRAQERWIGLSLLIAVVGIELGQVAINVRLSYFGRDWFNAIQEKDAAEFWKQLLFVFSPLAAIFIAQRHPAARDARLPHHPLAALDDREDDEQLARRLGPLPHAAHRQLDRQPGSAHRRRHQRLHHDHLRARARHLVESDLARLLLGDLVDAFGGLHLSGHRYARAGLPVLDRARLCRARHRAHPFDRAPADQPLLPAAALRGRFPLLARALARIWRAGRASRRRSRPSI